MLVEVVVAVIGFGGGVAAAGWTSAYLLNRNELRAALQFERLEEALRQLDVRLRALERPGAAATDRGP